jgi:hypothetical protein
MSTEELMKFALLIFILEVWEDEAVPACCSRQLSVLWKHLAAKVAGTVLWLFYRISLQGPSPPSSW